MQNLLDTRHSRRLALLGLFLVVFFTFWLASRQYTGPAYLSDEIGYLTKAAAIAGYDIDHATSWHGGYSLLLAPLFRILPDPFAVWQGILVLNALLWAGSFLLLFRLLGRLFPERGFWPCWLATAASAIYPAWITMSGYAFPSPAFTLFYLLALLMLSRTEGTRPLSVLPYSLLTGWLFWVHPTGIAVAASSIVFILLLAWRAKKPLLLVIHLVTVAGLILLYKFGLHAFLNESMTPEGMSVWQHYKNLDSYVERLLSLHTWVAWVVLALGQVSYLLVSTFGIITHAAGELITTLKPAGRKIRNILGAIADRPVLPAILLASLAVLLLGTLNSAGPSLKRIDHMIYGRYNEMLLLPLLGIGLLAPWTKRRFLLALFFIFISCIVIHFFSLKNVNDSLNLVNIPAFWPHTLFPDGSYPVWFLTGGIAIGLVGLLGKKHTPLLAFPLLLFVATSQAKWHAGILEEYSKPSSMVSLILDTFPPGTSIGFDTAPPAAGAMRERRNLMAFYFYKYKFFRMNANAWTNQEEGPLLTYVPERLSNHQDARIVAREWNSGLFLAVKPGMLPYLQALPNKYTNNLVTDFYGTNSPKMAGCFSLQHEKLAELRTVGTNAADSLTTDGRSGFLFYGPLVFLRAGAYKLEVRGSFADLEGASLDIAGHQGNSIFEDIDLSEHFADSTGTLLIPFTLQSNVHDLEVRLKVAPQSQLQVSGYEIIPEEKANQSRLPRKSRTFSPGALPTQVGSLHKKRLATTARAGFLAYGPYRFFQAGAYRLQIRGSARPPANAVIDIYSGKMMKTNASFPLREEAAPGILLDKTVTFTEDMPELEIRIWVSNSDQIVLESYTLTPTGE